MKLRKSQPSKFLIRIRFEIVALLCVVLILFSLIIYFYIRNAIIKNEFGSNEKILSQISYNIENVDRSIETFCTNLYDENDTVSLIYNPSEFFDNLMRVKRLQKLLISYPFVKSINVYDAESGILYSTSGFIRDTKGLFDPVLEENGAIPKLRPFDMNTYTINPSAKPGDRSLVYCMYDNTYSDTAPRGALIVEIDLSWFIDTIKHIAMTENASDKIYILNKKGGVIAGTGDAALSEGMKGVVSDLLLQKSGTSYVNQTVDGISQLITYLNIENAGIILLKTQAFDDVFSIQRIILVNIILITLVFLIVSFLPSYYVSRRIYKPLETLMNKDSSGNISPNEKKEYFLKKMLTDSLSEENASELLADNGNQIQSPIGFYICLIQIDRYKDFEKSLDAGDKSLYKYAVINIVCEVFSSDFRVEGVDIGDDKIGVFINTGGMPGNESSFYAELKKMIKISQGFVKEYFNLSFSAALSGYGENISTIPALYSAAVAYAQYRLVYGEASVITPLMIDTDEFTFFRESPLDFEGKLAKSIKSNKLEETRQLLIKLKKEFVKTGYTDVIVAMIKILSVFEDTVIELNKMSIKPVHIDFTALRCRIFEIETFDEFLGIVDQQLDILSKTREGNNLSVKHSQIADSAKAIIDNDYPSGSLCLQSLADKLKISSGYLGQIFRDAYGISIGEYINEIRLLKTAQLLETTTLNINEILSDIGIQNPTYFYSLFKKKYGITPKEYRQQISLKANTLNR